MTHVIYMADCVEKMREMDVESVDSVVTDPPAGISFMGKGWDSDKGGRDSWIRWMTDVALECFRILKPGGYALVWALPRTSHWTATAWEDAGFEVRDRIAHVFGSGFPKSADVSKHVDRMAGATREVVGVHRRHGGGSEHSGSMSGGPLGTASELPLTAPATEAAHQWAGWGTALKPAVEDWWVFRKPLGERTVAANVLRHGTGAINIDACRVGIGSVERDVLDNRSGVGFGTGVTVGGYKGRTVGKFKSHAEGRWPAHLVHDGSAEVAALFPETTSGALKAGHKRGRGVTSYDGGGGIVSKDYGNDSSSAARFFARLPDDDAEDGAARLLYVPKASKRDRNEGCEGLEASARICTTGRGLGNSLARCPVHDASLPSGFMTYACGCKQVYGDDAERRVESQNTHPTVKATALMRWLVRLVTPVGGVVLDPFCGSGSTLKAAILEGFSCIGVEKEGEYVEIAKARCAYAEKQTQKLSNVDVKKSIKKEPSSSLLDNFESVK